MEETRKCSICNNTHTMDSFEKNCHGEWFKLCNTCRCKGRKAHDKCREKQMGPLLQCNVCGEKCREATLPNHLRTYHCQPKVKGKPRIDYCTWLFQNEATLLQHDLNYLERIKSGSHIIVKDKYNSWSISKEAYETRKDIYDHYEEREHKYYHYLTRKETH